jgi:hypothetical protein
MTLLMAQNTELSFNNSQDEYIYLLLSYKLETAALQDGMFLLNVQKPVSIQWKKRTSLMVAVPLFVALKLFSAFLRRDRKKNKYRG